MPTDQYLVQHPEVGALFNRWMSRQSDQHNAALIAAYDFSLFRSVADVGGGQGSTLAAILQTNPPQRGILFDQPTVGRQLDPLAARDRHQLLGRDALLGHNADA